MNDLVTWLRAQLDEDERVAQSATSGPWANDDPLARDGVFASAIDGFVVDCDYPHMGPFAVHNATHIARHDPTRVLADVEAKRALLDAFDEPTTVDNVAEEEGLCRAVRIIATAYADRPGYLEEWRP